MHSRGARAGWVRVCAGSAAVVAFCLVPGLIAGCGGGGSLDKGEIVNDIDLPKIRRAVDAFKKDCGRYPETVEGLNALITKPPAVDVAGKWAGPYLPEGEKDLKDPWKNTYNYRLIARRERVFVKIWSSGPDGIEGTDDDIPPAPAFD